MPIGGHNVLEPAALGLPVITGEHVYNAQEIADMFVELGACHMVGDADELAATVEELLANPEQAAALGGKAMDLVQRNRGSLRNLLGLLDPLIGHEVRGG